MDLSGIISISGMSGLHKAVAQIKNGVIVESLLDKKRVPAYNTNKISALSDVAIYSTGEDIPSKDVLQKIYDKEKGGLCIDHKQLDAELKKYFKEAFPEYDEERVYTSDIKKVLMWYNILQPTGLLEKEEEAISEEEKVKLKADKEHAAKTFNKDNNSKSLKTAGSKVGTQGVRKTGVA